MTRRDWLAAMFAAQASAGERDSILRRMESVMGTLPVLPRTPPRTELIEETATANYSRRRIRYEAEPGDWVPAWMLIPAARPRAAVLCLHQTTRVGKSEPAGLAGKPDLHYAHELANLGLLTLAPDYPNFGDYAIDVYERGYASATMKGIVNHIRAVDLLAGTRGIRRIGAIGHSLGGHNTLFVAAFDQRIHAAVTSCGFTSFARYYGGDLTGWSHKGYMPRIASEFGRSPARMPFDFPDVLQAIAPRALFINAPLRDSNFNVAGVKECVAAVEWLFGRRLHAEYPDAGHEFPAEVRLRSYRFLADRLGATARASSGTRGN